MADTAATAPKDDAPQSEAQQGDKRSFRRKLLGKVKSNKMDKTVVVEVVRRYVARKYKKYLRSHRSYKAHDENNEYFVGDRVEIEEHRPLSKQKRWVVTRLIAASADRIHQQQAGSK